MPAFKTKILLSTISACSDYGMDKSEETLWLWQIDNDNYLVTTVITVKSKSKNVLFVHVHKRAQTHSCQKTHINKAGFTLKIFRSTCVTPGPWSSYVRCVLVNIRCPWHHTIFTGCIVFEISKSLDCTCAKQRASSDLHSSATLIDAELLQTCGYDSKVSSAQKVQLQALYSIFDIPFLTIYF